MIDLEELGCRAEVAAPGQAELPAARLAPEGAEDQSPRPRDDLSSLLTKGYESREDLSNLFIKSRRSRGNLNRGPLNSIVTPIRI